MQPEKENMVRQCPIVCLIFQRLCDDYQCGGAPVRVFEKFCFSFSFLPFFLFFSFLFLFFFSFSFLHFLFCLSLSRGPLAPGTMDIVHPCHPVATPLERAWGNFPPEGSPPLVCFLITRQKKKKEKEKEKTKQNKKMKTEQNKTF